MSMSEAKKLQGGKRESLWKTVSRRGRSCTGHGASRKVEIDEREEWWRKKMRDGHLTSIFYSIARIQ